jgi:hypothetical protein
MTESKDFVTELNERAAQSKSVWERIDGLINILQGRELTEENQMMLQLIVLVAEQVRPMGSQQDLEDITQDIGSMLNGLVEQFSKGKK